MFSTITVWAAIAAAFSVTGAVIYAAVKIRRFSREAFGTNSLIDGFRQQEKLLEERPKSVSGMTGIELPKIQRDFPEFNWAQWRWECENRLLQYLQGLEQQDIGCLKDASPSLLESLRLAIEDQIEHGIREVYSRATVHRTEINQYEKRSGLCRIIVQSSVEYYFSRSSVRADEVIRDHREQHRYRMELVYIQDPDKVTDPRLNAASVSCPNCGAPVSSLGAKHCSYCGSAVEPINIRAWVLHSIVKDI